MRLRPIIRFVILSVSAVAAANEPFRPGPAETYAHQSADQVTIGAKPFDRQELIEAAFGKKAHLLEYGVLPVLVVIQNKSQNAIDLGNIEVNLIASDGRRGTSVTPNELYHLAGKTKRPNVPMSPIPLPRKKNPLESPEIAARAFIARIIPPGDVATGFFYFEAKTEAGDKLYLNGIRQARTGKELLYFEFPLAP